MTEDYATMGKAQLQELLRHRGMSTAGTSADLVQRLMESDDPLGDPTDDMLNPSPEQTAPTPAGLPDPTPPPVTPALLDALTALDQANRRPTADTIYRATFDCPGELSNGLHTMFIQQTYALALQAGRTPRGGENGANAAHRTGFTGSGANRKAVYQIPVHPR